MKKLISILAIIILFAFSSICFSGVLHPKTGNSDHNPEIIVLSNNYCQCRYNIAADPNNGYSYDYIEVRELTEDVMKNALIENGQKCDPNEVSEMIMDRKDDILGSDDKEDAVVKDRFISIK